MKFPACKHSRKATQESKGLTWLAAEPFRLFFLSGAVWSIIGVSLWPLFYAGMLPFYPGITHARIMMECFGGAFVVGFLGTAGPRMASAPKLSTFELLGLFALHSAGGIFHLRLMLEEADRCFIAMLVLLLTGLLIRVARFRTSAPPPQMVLGLTGLICGITGTILLRQPEFIASLEMDRFAGLLLYQGLLLPPVLGIGSFLFPRMLGGEFGEPKTSDQQRFKLAGAILAALLIVVSFFLEAFRSPMAGYLLRAGTAAVYLLMEIKWRREAASSPRGSLATGLFWALGIGWLGMATAGFCYEHHVGLDHLLYIGGFGLLILVVASRVLFGHGGELAGFSKISWTPRILILMAVVAATTRASADFWPKILISHHQYAAWTWALCALIWLVWHRRRFLKQGDD